MAKQLVTGPLESRLELREILRTIRILLPVHELERFNDLFKTGDLMNDRLFHLNVNLEPFRSNIVCRLLFEHLEVAVESLPLAQECLSKPTENSYAFRYFILSKYCRHHTTPRY